MPLPKSTLLALSVGVSLLTGSAHTSARAAEEFTPPTREQALAALGSLDGETSAVRRLLTPDDSFEPIEAPGPADWLATQDEPGQTYANFVFSDVQALDATRKVIYLQPLGEFEADSAPSLDALRDYAAAFFQVEVVLLPAEVYESAAFEPRINSGTKKIQLRSTAVLTWLGQRLPADAFCLVAVTMTDLYPDPGWNFVYGQAAPQHRAGVFSFARNDPLFFGKERPEDFDTVLLQRSCKTLVHEIAHIFGLAHCIHHRCVQNGVNNEAESDSRPHHLCPICLRKLRYATGADLETRYRDLAYFFSQHPGWDEEEAWVRRQLAKLHRPDFKPPVAPRDLSRPLPYPGQPSKPLVVPPAPTPDLPNSPVPATPIPPSNSSDTVAPPIQVPLIPQEPLVASAP